MKLSNRLQYIADEIRWGETMADIGTDHGFLPLYLLNICKLPQSNHDGYQQRLAEKSRRELSSI